MLSPALCNLRIRAHELGLQATVESFTDSDTLDAISNAVSLGWMSDLEDRAQEIGTDAALCERETDIKRIHACPHCAMYVVRPTGAPQCRCPYCHALVSRWQRMQETEDQAEDGGE